MKLIRKLFFVTTLLLVAFSLASSISFATINKQINFQGKIVNKGVGDTDGTNIPDGNYDAIFSIYNVLSGGDTLWTETWNSGTTQVAVASGIFNVNLGTYATFPPSFDFNADSLYLAINFNADGYMSPRIRFTSVPYAFNAEKVNGLTVTATTGSLTIPNGIGISLNQSLTSTTTPTFAGLSISTSGIGVTGNSTFTNNLTIGTSLTASNNVNIGGTLTFTTTGVNIDTLGGNGLTLQGQAASTFQTTAGNIVLAPGGAVVIGTGTSTFTFNPASGPLYAGAARPSKVIRLSPEYPGAILSADGSASIGGTMTSDSVLNAGGNGWRNYYLWSSGNASLQDYSVIVRVALPADFDTWETGTCPGSTCALEIEYQTGLATTADNYIAVTVNNDSDTPGTAVCSIGSTAATTWGSSGCTEAVLNDAGAPEWDAASEIAVIRLKMAAKNTADALSRIGDIILRYKAKF